MNTNENYYYTALSKILDNNPSADFISDGVDLPPDVEASVRRVADYYSKNLGNVLDDLRDMQIEQRRNDRDDDDLRPGPD